MNISILTVFPALYEQFIQTSLIGRAQDKKIVSIAVESFFSFVQPKERIDAPVFGHGAGMAIRPEVVQVGIEQQEAKWGSAYKIFFSPQGIKLDQRQLRELAERLQVKEHLMLVAGRYEGIDARVETHYADLVLSIGDFVLMGGDLPAMVLLEGLLRLLPDVVGKVDSITHESFEGPFVDYPAYTTPVVWQGYKVPDVLRSGNHAAMEKWRQEQAVEVTVKKHFQWLRSCALTLQERSLAAKYVPSHYAALLHTDVLLPDGVVGTTSVTSLDIHDSARSAKTFGIKNYFIVTPLQDQKTIVQTLIDFWQADAGLRYNPHRHEALNSVLLKDDLQSAIEFIEQKEGKAPLLVATSARNVTHKEVITYYNQSKVWSHNRPVLFLFGTGKGIAPHIIDRCDYLLLAVEGFSDFNHLSVRAAMAIVFDRWLGINSER